MAWRGPISGGCWQLLAGERISLPARAGVLDRLGLGGIFTEGHLLDAECVAALGPKDIGRVLSPKEAAALLDRFDAAKKKPPAPSLKRRRAALAQARG